MVHIFLEMFQEYVFLPQGSTQDFKSGQPVQLLVALTENTIAIFSAIIIWVIRYYAVR